MGERSREAGAAGRGHEEQDVHLRPLIIAGVFLATLAGLSLLAMWWLFDYFAARQIRLQTDLHPAGPKVDLKVLVGFVTACLCSGQRDICCLLDRVDRDRGRDCSEQVAPA